MATEQMTALRNVLKACCPHGSENEAVSVPQMGELLNRTGPVQHQSLRRQISTLLRRGEVRKVGRGLFVWVPGKEPSRHGKSYVKMWRAIRMQHSAFAVCDIVQLARTHVTTVSKYMQWLRDEGFITQRGRQGNTHLYLLQDKGTAQRETPYPPIDPTDPYENERIACATLCRIFMTKDVALPHVARKVREQLAILQTRFNHPETKGEEQ